MVCVDCKELVKRVTELEKRLAKYENAHTPSSRNDFDKRELIPRHKHKKSGQKKGHKGVTRETREPDETVKVLQKRCHKCRHKLGRPTIFEKRRKEEIPKPQPVKLTEFLLAHYDCKNCGEHVVATTPEVPSEGVFGENILSHVTLLKYDGRLPHRKVVDALERDFGLNITPATVLDINRRVSDKLEPEYKEVIKKVRKSKIVYVDETKIRVGGTSYWIWVFSTQKYTFVVIRPSRGKNVLEEVLGKNYNGTIVCDGYRTYKNFTNKIQRCWAHLTREAKFVARKFAQAIPLAKAISRLYKKLVSKVSVKLSLEERAKLYRNAVRTLKRWLKKPICIERIQKLKNLIANGFEHWFTFIFHPRIKPTNNKAERALREHVVIRKIIGTLRNTKGTRIHEIITSMLATWKQQKLNLFTQLKEAIAGT